MKENIEFDYLVIIDLWNVDVLKQTGEPGQLPHNIDVYNAMNRTLLNNLQGFTFKNILISNGNLGPNLKNREWIRPEKNVSNYIKNIANENNINTYVLGERGENYYLKNKRDPNYLDITKKFNKTDKFLIAGRVFGICVHNRTFGIVSLLANGFQVYTSPLLTIGWEDMFVTQQEFENDDKINWSKVNNDPFMQKAESINSDYDYTEKEGYRGLKKMLENNE